MPNRDELQELANSALYRLEMSYVGSFMFNKAAERLGAFGQSALPTIERLIFEDVVSGCPIDAVAQYARFPGMGELLTGYFDAIRDSGDFTRGAGFLAALHGGVLIEAIRTATMAFHYRVPEVMNAIIRREAKSGVPDVREIAEWSLSRQAKELEVATETSRGDTIGDSVAVRSPLTKESSMAPAATTPEGASA